MQEPYIIFFLSLYNMFSLINIEKIKESFNDPDVNGNICKKTNSEWKEYYQTHSDMPNKTLVEFFNENYVDKEAQVISIKTIFYEYVDFPAYISTKPIKDLIAMIDKDGISVCSKYVIYVDYEEEIKKIKPIVLLSSQKTPSGHTSENEESSLDVGLGIGKICEEHRVIESVTIRRIT